MLDDLELLALLENEFDSACLFSSSYVNHIIDPHPKSFEVCKADLLRVVFVLDLPLLHAKSVNHEIVNVSELCDEKQWDAKCKKDEEALTLSFGSVAFQ